MNCRSCGKPLPAPIPGGRRARQFCRNACKQAFYRKAHQVEAKQENNELAKAQQRIAELEQEILHLRNRFDLERRSQTDYQPRSLKAWLKKQPVSPLGQRILANELIPPRGSRSTYEAYLRRMDYSVDEMQEFEHLWKALLLQS